MTIARDPAVAFDREADLYRLQRRPGYAHVLVNDDNRGVAWLDPWTGRELGTAGFPGPGIALDGWCLAASGEAALVLSDEERRAYLVPVGAGRASRGRAHVVEYPAIETARSVFYDWQGEALWLADPATGKLFELVWGADGAPRLEARLGVDAPPQLVPWVRMFRRLGPRALVARVQPDLCAAAFVDPDGPDGGRIGILDWSADTVTGAPAPAAAPRVAFAGRTLFVLDENAVRALDERGEIVAVLPAPAGFSFVDLDTLPPRDGRPAALVLLASSLGRRCARIAVHLLAPAQPGG